MESIPKNVLHMVHAREYDAGQTVFLCYTLSPLACSVVSITLVTASVGWNLKHLPPWQCTALIYVSDTMNGSTISGSVRKSAFPVMTSGRGRRKASGVMLFAFIQESIPSIAPLKGWKRWPWIKLLGISDASLPYELHACLTRLSSFCVNVFLTPSHASYRAK